MIAQALHSQRKWFETRHSLNLATKCKMTKYTMLQHVALVY